MTEELSGSLGYSGFWGRGIWKRQSFAAHPCFLCLDIASFQKASQAPFPPRCLPWFHCTNHKNRNLLQFHALHLTRSSLAPTISSLLHSWRVLLHTGACANAVLLTYLLFAWHFNISTPTQMIVLISHFDSFTLIESCIIIIRCREIRHENYLILHIHYIMQKISKKYLIKIHLGDIFTVSEWRPFKYSWRQRENFL